VTDRVVSVDDDGGGAEFAFLSRCLGGADAAGDDHRVVGFDADGGGADAEGLGAQRGRRQ